MKKISFLLLLAGMLSLSVLGQKSAITLTFTSAYYQGSYVSLDSIKVINNTQSVDTVLFYPDTVLVLESTLGIHGNKNQGNDFMVIQNCPNPSTGQAKISIFVPEKDKVGISVTDVRGRSLLISDWQLDKGYHLFYFTPGETGLLFLTATWKGIYSTIKMLSESAANHGNKLTYTGFEGTGLKLKSDKQALGFVFNPGDSLIYIGYAKTLASINGSDVLEDRPQSNKTYLFEIVEGIPCPGIPAVNYGGQIYTTVQINAQCWFKENLNIGTMIYGNQGQTDDSIIEKYCYNNNPANCDVYGGLYQWDEMMQYDTTQGAQGICPTGWHIPTDVEYTTLTDYLGGESIAGGKMKEVGTAHWAAPNAGATNSCGFTALPGGSRNPDNHFYLLVYRANFGLGSQYDAPNAWYRSLFYDSELVYRYNYYKTYGMSVRCIQD